MKLGRRTFSRGGPEFLATPLGSNEEDFYRGQGTEKFIKNRNSMGLPFLKFV